MDIGQEIGRKAHLLFPGGVMVDAEPWEPAEAVAHTSELIEDEHVPAIFEAAFEYDCIRIRVDVLERLRDGTWGLREVKSGTGLKDHYLDDLALQAFVLKGAGVHLTSIELVHVNSGYVRGTNDIFWPAFFKRIDVEGAIAARLVELPGRLSAIRDCLRLDDAPHAEPGKHCSMPYECEFWDRCTADKPADWIWHLPRLSSANSNALKTLGIESIASIPEDFPLTPKQAIIRNAVLTRQPFVSPDLSRLLADFGPPACYLDFEAMMPPIPLYEGTRPYQTIPFQWSLHAVTADGGLHHREFLAEGSSDPRRRFAETLIETLRAFEGPIVVYSAYEKTRLRELEDAFPDLSDSLNAILVRLADLLPIVRGEVYLPEFGFSNSIKSIAPALCPGFGYDDLEDIADGSAASAAFLQLACGHLKAPEEVEQFRAALLAYCRRDTVALVEVHRALTRLAVHGPHLARVASPRFNCSTKTAALEHRVLRET